MKLGRNVTVPQNSNSNADNDNSPYTEIIQKRISSFKPRFEKGSSAGNVADVVLEAVTSNDPKARYLVGEDALKMVEEKRNTSDEEFGRLVMKSVLGKSSS